MNFRTIVILSAIINLHLSINAQGVMDTLYSNARTNVALFFPSPIQRAVTGHSDFIFSYNRDKEEHYGLLQTTSAATSNLLVITSDGRVYCFILSHSDNPPSYHHFISQEQSVGFHRPTSVEEALNQPDLVSQQGQQEYLSNFSSILLGRPPQKGIRRGTMGLKLQLENMVYHGQFVYLVMGIKNRSSIDFEIKDIVIHRINGNKKRRSPKQEIPLKVLYEHHSPKLVKTNQSVRFVYVIPKFVLGKNETLKVVVLETKGNRTIELLTKGKKFL